MQELPKSLKQSINKVGLKRKSSKKAYYAGLKRWKKHLNKKPLLSKYPVHLCLRDRSV